MRLSLFSRNKLANSCDARGRLDPNANQGVDKLGHDLCQFFSVGVRKTEFSFMGKFVAGVSAGINHLSDIGRHPFAFLNGVYLFPKHVIRLITGNFTCFGNVIRELFQADTKKYAGAPGRQINNFLGFDKVFFYVFRHFFGRLDSHRCRVTKLAFFPKDQPVTGLTLGKDSLFYRHDLCHVLHADGLISESASKAHALEDVIPRNGGFEFGNNRQRKNRCNSPAVRASIGV